jgi:pimeloyl-ACP methyl ester carboxylesterase
MADRPALLLLCGLLSDATVWQPVADRLVDVADVRIVDFAGCRSIGEMAERVLDDAPARFAVAGHSMGARVALEIVARAPERVERIALVNTGVHPVSAAEPAGRQRLLDLAASEGMAAIAADWLPPMLGDQFRTDPAFIGPMAAMVERQSLDSYQGQIAAMLSRPDSIAPLASVTVPVVLISAEQDAWAPPAQHEAMLEQVPHARHVTIANSGHFMPFERPGETADILREWLAD